MKTRFKLLVLALLIISISCKKENSNGKTDKLLIKNISFTECLNDSKKSASSLSCFSLKAIENKYLEIQQQNTMFCCGTEKVEIKTEIKNDTIFISEIDLGPFTYCYCWHDLNFEIGPLENKTYVMQIIGCETSYDQDSILIEFQYSNNLDFSNCK
jgi:hypothetical protein